MTERHIIKIYLEIKYAKLLVRFPCKLHFQLKTGITLTYPDTSQTDSKHSYELKKG